MRGTGLAVALLAIVLCGCGGRDATFEPPAELQEIEQRLPIERLWSTRVGRGAEGLRLGLRPSTDGERVYAGSFRGTAAALDAGTGRVAWSVDTELPLSAGPGLGAGVLAFGTADGRLLLLDSETGEERWRVAVGSEVLAAPAVGASVIALTTSDGKLRGYSIATGAEIWSVSQSLPALTVRGDTAPEIAGQNVVAGFDNGRIGVYRLSNGELLWERAIGAPAGRTELDRLVDIGARLAVVGDDVYVVGYRSLAVAFDVNNGLQLWQGQQISSLAGLTADLEQVYVTTDVDYVTALLRTNGTPRWTQEALRRRELTAPVRYRTTVVVGDLEGYLHWLDIDDGSIVARARPSSARIAEPPIVVGGSLVVQSEDGRVSAFAVVEEPPESEEGQEPQEPQEEG